MLQSYLTLAFRHLTKQKAFSIVNLCGLSIGILAAFLITQYVDFETSFDRFHGKADRIYRVCFSKYQDGVLQYQKAQVFIPTGEALKNEFSQVEDYTTLFKISDQTEIIISHRKNDREVITFNEANVYHVKGNFFDIFTLPLIHGKQVHGTLPPKSVVISASVAKKYFGNETPLDKVIHHAYNGPYHVIGVFDDMPENSHFKPEFLFSWESLSDDASGGDANNWRWDGFFTYVVLSPNTVVSEVERGLPAFTKKYLGNDQTISAFWLQPLTDIHLHSQLTGEIGVNGDVSIVRILRALAVFILIIAYINYINLSSAKASERAKEIGIRKIVGSARLQLIIQFVLESFIINVAALALAIALLFLMSNQPLQWLGFPITLLKEETFWYGAVLMLFLGAISSGIYPALVMSSYKPIKVLKRKPLSTEGRYAINVRRAMVTFQFMLAITLIAGSGIIHKQIKFMQHRDLGIDISNTIVLQTFAKFGPIGSDSLFLSKLEVLQQQLSSNRNITGVAASYDIPGKEHLSKFSNFRSVTNSEELVSLYYSRIDPQFLPIFHARLLAGRNFSNETAADNQAIIINLEALKALGFKNPEEAIFKTVMYGREPNLRTTTIIGVVDFRATSFKDENYPIAYQIAWGPLKYLLIKFRATDFKELENTVSSVNNQWKAIFPDQPFSYFFLDDFFNNQYRAEQKFSATLNIFTGLAIFVACLGLYGLSEIVITQRAKELSIRKVLGASVENLFFLLSKDYGVMMLLAGAISIPVVWYAMNQWLGNYTYQTDFSWWLFGLPLLTLTVIVYATVGLHILRAASANPVETLKHE